MHIFIDETGTFTGVGTVSAPSLVGALIIPDAKLQEIYKRYEKIRPFFPKDKGEVKGRLLNAKQVNKVVEMLRRNEVLFEAILIDLSLHTEVGLTKHRSDQAEKITAGLTDQHSPGLRAGVQKLRDQLEAMPIQQYVQSVLNFELLSEVLKQAPLYYAQRRPKELGHFHWIVDAKEKQGGITKWEEWWSLCVRFMLQSKSQKDPTPMLIGSDYTHFDRFIIRRMPTTTEQEVTKSQPSEGQSGLIDLRMILTESFRFSSQPELGLELVDIVSNAVRRALKGNLEQDGWKGIPSLMIHRKSQYVSFLSLNRREANLSLLPYNGVLRKFTRGGRTMLTRNEPR